MGQKLGCQSSGGGGGHKAVSSPPRGDASSRGGVSNSTEEDMSINKVGPLRSGHTSHTDDLSSRDCAIAHNQAGGARDATVVNPLDPQQYTFPIEDGCATKSALEMRDVALTSAPVTAAAASTTGATAANHRPAAERRGPGAMTPTRSQLSPMHRSPPPAPAFSGGRPSRSGSGTAEQRTLASAAGAQRSGEKPESSGSHSRLDVSGPFMGHSRRESSLTDITMDDESTSPMRASISGNFRYSTGLGFPYRGEDLELQRQQAPLSIEEDLFIYDDIVISKDEARTKHWRLAGRKPALQLEAAGKSSETSGGGRAGSPSAAAAAKRLSTSGAHKFFSFNDFDVCVDEVDFAIARPTEEQLGPMGPTLDGTTTSPLTSSHALTEDEAVSTATLPGSGACGASFYAKLSDRVTVMSTVPTVHNTGLASDAREYESHAKTGRVLKDFSYETIIGHATRVKCIALCPNEKDYASCSNEDASVTLCNLGVRDEVGIFTGHVDTVINATFSPDGKYLATTSKDRTMILWDVMTTKKILTFSHAKVVICCCFAPDSKYLVSGCQDRVCRLWDTRRGKEWLSYTQHDGIIISIAFSPDGNYVCSASADKTLRVWSTSTAKTRFTLTGHTGIILACSYSNDGKHIISNDETALRVWSTEDGSCKLSLSPSQVAGSTHLTAKGPKLGWTLSCAAPGAFTNYLLVACNNRFVYVIDLHTGNEVHSVFCKAPVYCLAAGTKDTTACGDSFGNIYVLHLK